MSFRKKNKKAGGEDVKISIAADSKPAEGEEQPAAEVTETPEAEATVPPAEETEEAIEVPEGTTAEILQWVDGDKAKAQAALDKESAEEKPRKGLTGELEEILAEDEAEDAPEVADEADAEDEGDKEA